MKNYKWLLFVMIVIFGGILYWKSPSSVLVPAPLTNVPHVDPGKSVVEFLAAPIPLPRVKNKAGDGCEQRWNRIAKIDLNEYSSVDPKEPGLMHLDRALDLIAHLEQIENENPCAVRKEDPKPYHEFSQLFKSCRIVKKLGLGKATELGEKKDMLSPFNNTWVRSTPLDKCLAHFTLLRQEISLAASKDIPISQINDVPTLMNRFFSVGKNHTDEIDTLVAIAERMQELEPENVAVASIAVQVAYAAFQKERKLSGVQSSEKFEKAFEILEQLSPGDLFLSQYKLQYDLDREEITDVQLLTESLEPQDSTRNLADYYRAQVAYRNGEIDLMKRLLSRITQSKQGDLKAEAYIALKRMEREPAFDTKDRPLFPGPGVILVNQFVVTQPNGMSTVHGMTGFSLIEDKFMQMVHDYYSNDFDNLFR